MIWRIFLILAECILTSKTKKITICLYILVDFLCTALAECLL